MGDLLGIVLGGLIGGLVSGFVPWAKYRDAVGQRLIDAYCDLFVAVDRGVRQLGDLYWTYLKNPDDKTGRDALNRTITRVSRARVRVEFMETRESCLRRLAAIKDALNAVHALKDRAYRDLDEFSDAYNSTIVKVIEARDDMMREARMSSTLLSGVV